MIVVYDCDCVSSFGGVILILVIVVLVVILGEFRNYGFG